MGQRGDDLQFSLVCSGLPHRPHRGGCPHALSECRSLWQRRQRVGPGTYFWTDSERFIAWILTSAGGVCCGEAQEDSAGVIGGLLPCSQAAEYLCRAA